MNTVKVIIRKHCCIDKQLSVRHSDSDNYHTSSGLKLFVSVLGVMVSQAINELMLLV